MVAPSLHIEVVDVVVAERDGERLPDFGHGDPEVAGQVRLHVKDDLRLVHPQALVHHEKLPALLGLRHDLRHYLVELSVVRSLASNDELNGHADLVSGQRWDHERVELHPGHLIELLLKREPDFALASLTLAPRLQARSDERAVYTGGTRDRKRDRIFGKGFEELRRFFGVVRGVVDVGVHGRSALRHDDALVLIGGELHGCRQEQDRNAHEDGGGKHQDHRTVAEHVFERAFVAALDLPKHGFDPFLHPRFLTSLEKPRAHHRRKRQRNDSGDDHRPGQSERELGKQRSGEASDKADRCKHGRKREGHHDDGAGDLSRTELGGFERGLSLVDVPLHVLDDDDCVVDDQADGDHHGEEGQEVEREVERLHEEDHPDQRQRNRHDRDQHGAKASHEEEDHEDHDGCGDPDRIDDLVDRVFDEDRLVEQDVVLQPFRHAARHLREQRLDRVDDGNWIRIGGLLDLERHCRLVLDEHFRAVGLRAELHLGDVAEPRQRVALLPHDELLELLRVFERGVRGDRSHREEALDLAGGGLVVVVPECLKDVRRPDHPRRHLLGIEPDTHRVFGPSKDVDLADAIHRFEERLDDPRQVLGDLLRRHRVRVEPHVEDGDLGAGLLLDHRLHGVARKLALHLRYLRQDLHERRVGVIVELDVGLNLALARDRRRREVVDALGRRHRGLKGGGNEALNQILRCPWVQCGDRDHRVLHLGELAHGDAGKALQPEQQDHQTDHGRENGALDEDVGKAHVTPEGRSSALGDR